MAKLSYIIDLTPGNARHRLPLVDRLAGAVGHARGRGLCVTSVRLVAEDKPDTVPVMSKLKGTLKRCRRSLGLKCVDVREDRRAG